jgi:hypothetical protein
MSLSHEGQEDFPRPVVTWYEEDAYDALSEESLLTGDAFSTIANRAARIYKKIMDAQRDGKKLAFIDNDVETVYRIDD